MNQTKRPVGVTILAWIIIVSSGLNLPFNFLAMAVNPPISVYFYFLISTVSIVAGIFLLCLKNWARRAILWICLMVAVENIATAPYAMGKMESATGGMPVGLNIVMLVLVGGVVLFQGWVIFYLTRPKIREQFERTAC
jgi:hypothetical protein